MRILVLGGTRFIGRAAVDVLVERGHEVLVAHRGGTEPEGLAPVPHLHVAREQLADRRAELTAFGPEAIVDCLSMSAAGAHAALAALDGVGARWVVLSSQDVYRAFSTLQAGLPATDPVPVDEDAPLRADRTGQLPGGGEYSKRDVEEAVAAVGAVVLRLPMTYGPHDYQRREEPVLRRVRAGRRRIPVGPADGLLPTGYVADVALGVALAVEAQGVEGHVFNLAEAAVDPVGLRMRRVLDAAGWDADLVEVPAGTPLPEDLSLTASLRQPMVVSSAKARAELGYVDTGVELAVAASVRWHLEHPPDPQGAQDFAADDAALAAAG